MEREFLTLNRAHKRDPNLVLIDKIDATRAALNLAYTSKAEKSLRWSGARFY